MRFQGDPEIAFERGGLPRSPGEPSNACAAYLESGGAGGGALPVPDLGKPGGLWKMLQKQVTDPKLSSGRNITKLQRKSSRSFLAFAPSFCSGRPGSPEAACAQGGRQRERARRPRGSRAVIRDQREAGEGVSGAVRPVAAFRISPLPSAGYVHRPKAAAAAGAGPHVAAVFLLHPGVQEPPPLPPLRGLLMSRRCRGTAGTDSSLPHGSGPVGFLQAGPPLPLSPAPAYKHTRVVTRPRAVPAALGSREAAPVGTLPKPRHQAQQPSLPGECIARRLRKQNTRLSLPLLRLLPPRCDALNPASSGPRRLAPPVHLPFPALPPMGRQRYADSCSAEGSGVECAQRDLNKAHQSFPLRLSSPEADSHGV
uniref:uncharacterized protein LOC118151518 n=1 Tax=Callithrix jacchus TaxID=9483 RepID=UPI0023DCF4BE|nr:uncharacterized protein LOC118151518 [Callithrix jacchus]